MFSQLSFYSNSFNSPTRISPGQECAHSPFLWALEEAILSLCAAISARHQTFSWNIPDIIQALPVFTSRQQELGCPAEQTDQTCSAGAVLPSPLLPVNGLISPLCAAAPPTAKLLQFPLSWQATKQIGSCRGACQAVLHTLRAQVPPCHCPGDTMNHRCAPQPSPSSLQMQKGETRGRNHLLQGLKSLHGSSCSQQGNRKCKIRSVLIFLLFG